MTTRSFVDAFPRGVLRPELFLGVVSSVSARKVGVNLSEAGRASGSHYEGHRYGRGEVGEYVLIEGQCGLLLGRVAAVELREPERRSIRRDFAANPNLDAIGSIQLLGCVAADTLGVTAGVEAYPRLGDRIYAAPHRFIAMLPRLMEPPDEGESAVTLSLGVVDAGHAGEVEIKPERLFGRHCAILGATGGGKSWTTARIIEECLRHRAKVVLLDATGEYRDITGSGVVHCHLGDPIAAAAGSRGVSLPPHSFVESDFVALFEPAGKVQGPKMRAAIRSLRLARIQPRLAPNGLLRKHDQLKAPVVEAELDAAIAPRLDDPSEQFDVGKLVAQIHQECHWPNAGSQRAPDETRWGGCDDSSYSHCLSLFARISGVLASPAFQCVFAPGTRSPVTELIEAFASDENRLLRMCLSAIHYEYSAREVIANAIGRHLLTLARRGVFLDRPTIAIIDEAHNFLGRRIGSEDYTTKLDAFELVAKEGRKYGLTVCLASQRPRDITEGVLSQMGTLIVHRLTNDRDREVVERACGEIDRAATAFLPNLRPGEAAIIGTDFPIPLTLRVHPPVAKPLSEGPKYQQHWNATTAGQAQSASDVTDALIGDPPADGAGEPAGDIAPA